MKGESKMNPGRNWLLLATVLALTACDSSTDENRIVGELASDRIELSR